MITRMFTAALVASALVLAACGGGSALPTDTSTPEGSVGACVEGLKDNDIKSVAEAVVPQDAMQQARSKWQTNLANMSESEKQQFDQVMGMLTAEGAENTLFAMAEPQLPEYQQQLQFASGLMGMAAMGIDQQEGLSAEEKDSAKKFVGALNGWLSKVDLTDTDTVKQAIAIACETARDLDVPNASALQQLSFDQALGKGGEILAGAKQVLALYDLDLNEVLDSVEVGAPAVDGQQAKVPVSLTWQGEDFKFPVTLQQQGGRWFANPPQPTPPAMAPPMESDGSMAPPMDSDIQTVPVEE